MSRKNTPDNTKYIDFFKKDDKIALAKIHTIKYRNPALYISIYDIRVFYKDQKFGIAHWLDGTSGTIYQYNKSKKITQCNLEDIQLEIINERLTNNSLFRYYEIKGWIKI